MTKSIQQSAVSNQPSAVSSQRSADGGRRWGFTLAEVMIVIAIIAILAVVVAWAGSRVLKDAKVKQTRAVMNSLKAAITECMDAGVSLPTPPQYATKVPNGSILILEPTDVDGGKVVRIDYYRQVRNGTWTPVTSPTANHPDATEGPLNGIWAVPDGTTKSPYPDAYESQDRRVYGIQALYHCLMQEPHSKQVLVKMGSTSFARGTKLSDCFPSQVSDFLIGPGAGTQVPHETQAILDAWGMPMYYGWEGWLDPERKHPRAYVRSAGPDGVFGNGDDMFSHKE